jgi:hypothetical protein
MKKITILFFTVFIINNLFADELDDFRDLPALDKIQKILDEYRYDRNFAYRLKFAQYATILTENPRENIPILFKYLKDIPMLPLMESMNDYAYEIIDILLWQIFHMNNKLLNQNELNSLAEIYQQKINECLEVYKIVDVAIVLAESQIEVITGKRRYGVIRGTRKMADTLYNKYTKLGYKDLRIDYTNLRN